MRHGGSGLGHENGRHEGSGLVLENRRQVESRLGRENRRHEGSLLSNLEWLKYGLAWQDELHVRTC